MFEHGFVLCLQRSELIQGSETRLPCSQLRQFAGRRFHLWRDSVGNIQDYFDAVNSMVTLRHNTVKRGCQRFLGSYGVFPFAAPLPRQERNDGLLQHQCYHSI